MLPSPLQDPPQRILLKISGESFGNTSNPFAMNIIHSIAQEIREVHLAGKQIGIVVGGGNIVRGAELEKYGIRRAIGDYMGMLATVINALALQDILSNLGIETKVLTSRRIEGVGEPYHYQRCLQYLRDSCVVIFAGGTGSPYFTTDTAAALKAVEMKAQIFFKATKVDGVYEEDPIKNKNARKFDTLTYEQMLVGQYRVMDATAVAFCLENDMPLLIFNLMIPGNFLKASRGEMVGTLIKK